ncbi:MAG: 6-carboxytetrahydropterin synthase [Thermoanaerobaculia bacterium]|nr:6-carboxytetrahydropterin synthase [Thermoanaerobaculia bacterium]
MSSEGTWTLVLAKEDFKFSSAHFTLFGPEEAELLHGHNYRVKVELAGSELDDEGLLVSFEKVKGAIRELCAWLDDKTLVPQHSRHLQVRAEDESVEIIFAGRRYVLPAQDVLLLPLANTSIELLARLLWQKLAPRLDGLRVETLSVEVAETAGQSCVYRGRLG